MTELAKLKSLRVVHAIWKFKGSEGLPTWADGQAHIQKSSKARRA